MRITINHLDYTAALDAAAPLTIERVLNAPTACRFSLALPPDKSLPSPARLQPIAITGDDGSIYFTGYVASTPLPQYAGLAMEGPQFRLAIHAVSDEILLDQAQASGSKGASGLAVGALLANIANHAGAGGALDTSGLTLSAPIHAFTPDAGAPFSKSAGQVASQARATYRAQGGKLQLSAIPAAVHRLDETTGSLTLSNLTFARNLRRDLANDITVCGQHEAAAYVTEILQGDGATTSFSLKERPYFPPASQSTLIAERFDEPCIDLRNWANPTGNTYFSIGASGLVMSGGNGIDGDTQLSWHDPVEMGGTLLLEAEGVTLSNASTGLLSAFFGGDQASSACVAGFQADAQQVTENITLQPMIFGAACGVAFPVNPANQYSVRIRIHAPEQQRARASYLSFGDDGAISNGGQLVASPASLHFEIQEFVNGVASMPVTLYEGGMTNMPAVCVIVAASSLNLRGSMRALNLTNLGSGWVVSSAPDGSTFTRRMGSAAQSAECSLERSGRLVFNTGFAPAAGEQITVRYRSTARSVGRAVNTESQQRLASQQLPGSLAWIGSVTNPPARTSADCRNAAATLAQSASSAAALWAGTWRGTNFELVADVWPGDALALNAPSCNLNAQLVVRNVKLLYRSSVPDLVSYEIAFANDWSEDLAIQTSDAVPADVWLPAPASPQHAANLNALTVTAVNGNLVTINTGATAPEGGGFEIRNRDDAFMLGDDPSLVMRGSQPNLTFTRRSAADRFYVRMFDGANPPNYSEFSAALFFSTPLSA